jgi:hypothetical protein
MILYQNRQKKQHFQAADLCLSGSMIQSRQPMPQSGTFTVVTLILVVWLVLAGWRSGSLQYFLWASLLIILFITTAVRKA